MSENNSRVAELKDVPRAVLVCGLGQLGQHCAVLLKELGIPVYGLTDVEPPASERARLLEALDRMTLGDCSRHSSLEQAGIHACRAVLVTTRDERVNVMAALAARSLNPDARLVVRSSQTNLNRLLHERLGNLIALDFAELPAAAFSLAAIGGETVGLFAVDGYLLRVVEHRITGDHPWHNASQLSNLNTRSCRVLHWTQAADPRPLAFHEWDPGACLTSGDRVVVVELNEPQRSPTPGASLKELVRSMPAAGWTAIRARLTQALTGASVASRLLLWVAVSLLTIHGAGVLLYRWHYPEISLLDAVNVATVMIFEGYSNMFAQLKLPFPIPWWLLLFSLLMTVSGAIVMGIFYAALTARIVSARLRFSHRTGRIPRGDHVVVIGLGPLGLRVAELIGKLGRSVVCVGDHELDPSVLPGVPVVIGDPRQCLPKAGCATAASVAVLTDNDITNLEIGLMASQMNPDCNLVIRTDDDEFGNNARLLAPHTQTMSAYALAAEAYAGAALGKVLGLLRIGPETVLATEYRVEPGGTLINRLVAEVMYGYGLIVVMYQSQGSDRPQFFPPEDTRLEAGARLVVLATSEGLQNVEHGRIADKPFQVRLVRTISPQGEFDGSRTIARVTGCALGTARAQMGQLPTTIPGLFHHQAARLVRELRLAGVEAESVPPEKGS